MTGKIFSPLLLLLAKLTESDLFHTIQFLKAENEILRSRLLRSVRTTPAERSRLLKLAKPLGNAVKELISIVTFRTFQRWRADAKKTWVSIFKRECLNKLIVFGEGHLQHIAETYVAYHNSVRPHSGLDNAVVGNKRPTPEAVEEEDGVVCESWLGGLLRHYRRAEA